MALIPLEGLGAPSQKTSLLGGVTQILINSRPSPRLADVGLFVRHKSQHHCTFLAYELIRDFKKKLGPQSICIKIDLQKAFESINRDFIYYLMHCMIFPPLWINWIKECLSTPTFSVMVKGSPTGFFQRKQRNSTRRSFFSLHICYAYGILVYANEYFLCST